MRQALPAPAATRCSLCARARTTPMCVSHAWPGLELCRPVCCKLFAVLVGRGRVHCSRRHHCAGSGEQAVWLSSCCWPCGQRSLLRRPCACVPHSRMVAGCLQAQQHLRCVAAALCAHASLVGLVHCCRCAHAHRGGGALALEGSVPCTVYVGAACCTSMMCVVHGLPDDRMRCCLLACALPGGCLVAGAGVDAPPTTPV